ncbi:hypothetical protein HZI73_05605 [Vallitalea pronyensis]|uniref:Uncharacterized protein n=1 Tax=Vallitalea pronyensis TaxID=1348613 RepID=A0A8J8MHU3_9FIRM|nr:hypothetical protein [Vallitalea pronyensis]QUI21801.1 hypothetical protein HZI73_05605 [Vallitalea pronyensis]
MESKIKTIGIFPNKGISNIDLRMDKMEVHKNIGIPFVVKENSCYLKEAYLNFNLVLEYNDYKVSNIEFARPIINDYKILLYDIEIFKVNVHDFIQKLMSQYHILFDSENIKDSSLFECKELGMNFWRTYEEREYFEAISIY